MRKDWPGWSQQDAETPTGARTEKAGLQEGACGAERAEFLREGTVTVSRCPATGPSGGAPSLYLRGAVILLEGHQDIAGDMDFLGSVDLLRTHFPASGCALPRELGALQRKVSHKRITLCCAPLKQPGILWGQGQLPPRPGVPLGTGTAATPGPCLDPTS